VLIVVVVVALGHRRDVHDRERFRFVRSDRASARQELG